MSWDFPGSSYRELILIFFIYQAIGPVGLPPASCKLWFRRQSHFQSFCSECCLDLSHICTTPRAVWGLGSGLSCSLVPYVVWSQSTYSLGTSPRFHKQLEGALFPPSSLWSFLDFPVRWSSPFPVLRPESWGFIYFSLKYTFSKCLCGAQAAERAKQQGLAHPHGP